MIRTLVVAALVATTTGGCTIPSIILTEQAATMLLGVGGALAVQRFMERTPTPPAPPK